MRAHCVSFQDRGNIHFCSVSEMEMIGRFGLRSSTLCVTTGGRITGESCLGSLSFGGEDELYNVTGNHEARQLKIFAF